MDELFPAPDGFKKLEPRTKYNPRVAAAAQLAFEMETTRLVQCFLAMSEERQQRLFVGLQEPCLEKWLRWLAGMSPEALQMIRTLARLSVGTMAYTRLELMRQPLARDPEANHG